MSTRSWWGWGWEDKALSDAECISTAALIPGLPATPLPIPRIADLNLEKPRVTPPETLAEIFSDAPYDRAGHALGKAYRDVVRALHRDIDHPPDLVAFPEDEQAIVDVLDWAGETGTVVVPYGAGSSVVGGTEYRGDRPWISLDLTRLNRVLEIDRTSRAARIQAGALGPVLEDQLRPHGLTLRHFPQSFEFSTLGGWLATRSGGHYATLHTRIDDFTQSLRVVTPAGITESWRLPGSGAGPSPDALFLGSEGTLGIITEAWMRLQDIPAFKSSTSVTFDDFPSAVQAIRAIAQSGLNPSNCRLLDPGEASLSGASRNGQSVLVLGFESAHAPVDHALAQAVELARDHGGTPSASKGRDTAVSSWRETFLRMPYVRDGLTRMSAIVETFETACTWDRTPDLYQAVNTELAAAITKITGAPGLINCRFTHVYPDGPAPYFTIIAASRPGSERAMWDDLKSAAMDLLTRHHATITHHHAVGRDHRPAYDRQRPPLFAATLASAKRTLDPGHVLNPGVLLD